MTQTVSPPGPKSLTCLSCHDGTVAIDSIVNMPGSGRYNAASQTSHQETFLDSWAGGHEGLGISAPKHIAIGGGNLGSVVCISCHSSPSGSEVATDFTVFYIGLDLTNDHPVGVVRPDTPGFAQPSAQNDYFALYDTNGNTRPDVEEIRFYKSNGAYKVECASCHDPHGVPSDGPDSVNNPTFLRKNNQNGSAVCLTCHIR